jgi:hypothetical protein
VPRVLPEQDLLARLDPRASMVWTAPLDEQVLQALQVLLAPQGQAQQELLAPRVLWALRELLVRAWLDLPAQMDLTAPLEPQEPLVPPGQGQQAQPAPLVPPGLLGLVAQQGRQERTVSTERVLSLQQVPSSPSVPRLHPLAG